MISEPGAIAIWSGEVLITVSTSTQSARCSTPVEVSGGAGGSGTGPDGGADGNLEPMATFKTTPDAAAGKITGTAPFMVRYNVCLTADPEGDTLYFTMDLDGDGKLDVRGSTGASCRADWTYAAGTWFAEVCVTDILPDGKRLHDFQCEGYTVVAS